VNGLPFLLPLLEAVVVVVVVVIFIIIQSDVLIFPFVV
jgi:hypothetical protein